MNDDAMKAFLRENGYSPIKKLPDGRWIGLMPMIYTIALCVDLHETGFEGKYCYANSVDALNDFDAWTGVGDPPGKWIKFKSMGCERSKMESVEAIEKVEDPITELPTLPPKATS